MSGRPMLCAGVSGQKKCRNQSEKKYHRVHNNGIRYFCKVCYMKIVAAEKTNAPPI